MLAWSMTPDASGLSPMSRDKRQSTASSGRRPVLEACLTYEPDDGVIEVVAKDRGSREEYVRLFARELLGVDFDAEDRLPVREYDLSPLLSPHEFSTDAADRIEHVRVISL